MPLCVDDLNKIVYDYHNMSIRITLDVQLARKKMSLTELSQRVGVSMTNLSLLKTGKVKAIRFSTLEAICEALDCQPGDLLEHVPDDIPSEDTRGEPP